MNLWGKEMKLSGLNSYRKLPQTTAIAVVEQARELPHFTPTPPLGGEGKCGSGAGGLLW